jgi:hypothetical protein
MSLTTLFTAGAGKAVLAAGTVGVLTVGAAAVAAPGPAAEPTTDSTPVAEAPVEPTSEPTSSPTTAPEKKGDRDARGLGRLKECLPALKSAPVQAQEAVAAALGDRFTVEVRVRAVCRTAESGASAPGWLVASKDAPGKPVAVFVDATTGAVTPASTAFGVGKGGDASKAEEARGDKAKDPKKNKGDERKPKGKDGKGKPSGDDSGSDDS